METDVVNPASKTFFANFVGCVTFYRSYTPSMLQWLSAIVKFMNKPGYQYCSLSINECGVQVKKEEKHLIDFSEDRHNQPMSTSQCTFLFSVPGDDPLHVMQSDCDSPLLKVSFDQVVEIVMPSECEKSYIAVVINQKVEDHLNLYVYQPDNIKEVSYQ